MTSRRARTSKAQTSDISNKVQKGGKGKCCKRTEAVKKQQQQQIIAHLRKRKYIHKLRGAKLKGFFFINNKLQEMSEKKIVQHLNFGAAAAIRN